MLMAGREQLWSSEPHPGLVPSGRSRVPCQLWVTWAGLKELGELEDRAGRLEPWARVTWGSAAGLEGTAGPFSKEPVGRRLCLCFAWTWASEELRRQGSLRCQVWSQLGEGRAGQVSPGWGVGRRAGVPLASPLAPFLSLLVWQDSASPAHPVGSAPLGSAPVDSRALRATGSSHLGGSPSLPRGTCLPAVPPPGLPSLVLPLPAHGCQTHRERGSLLALPGIPASAASPSQGAGVGTDGGEGAPT